MRKLAIRSLWLSIMQKPYSCKMRSFSALIFYMEKQCHSNLLQHYTSEIPLHRHSEGFFGFNMQLGLFLLQSLLPIMVDFCAEPRYCPFY